MMSSLGRAAGCAGLAVLVTCGTSCGGPSAPPTDPGALERSCTEKRLPSCVTLAYDYSTGAGVPRDPARSAALYDTACRGGLVVGCVNLGVQRALGAGVAEDRASAARLFRDACLAGPAGDASVPVACVNLGVLIDGGFAEPAGQTSQGLFDRACHAGVTRQARENAASHAV